MTNCTVPACGGRIVARGYCGKHYQRWSKHGDPLATLTPTRGVFVACAADGCERRGGARGLCKTHYSRWAVTGDPLGLRRAPNGAGWISHGYRVLSAPGHPLATQLGRVFEHRKVLFDKIGPGEHPCHWCAKTVSWDRRENAGESTLIADHLDSDTLHNDPSNLVPSCWKCNVNRGKSA
jgi:hypothetical protein